MSIDSVNKNNLSLLNDKNKVTQPNNLIDAKIKKVIYAVFSSIAAMAGSALLIAFTAGVIAAPVSLVSIPFFILSGVLVYRALTIKIDLRVEVSTPKLSTISLAPQKGNTAQKTIPTNPHIEAKPVQTVVNNQKDTIHSYHSLERLHSLSKKPVLLPENPIGNSSQTENTSNSWSTGNSNKENQNSLKINEKFFSIMKKYCSGGTTDGPKTEIPTKIGQWDRPLFFKMS